MLACDGLWDVVSAGEAAEVCFAYRHSAAACAEALETIAKARHGAHPAGGGYRDDISVIVVFVPLRLQTDAGGREGFPTGSAPPPEPAGDGKAANGEGA